MEDGKVNIILITYRDINNPNFIPAEEIFMKISFQKFNLEYKVIEYDYTDNTSFFGRLPIIYFNGNIITMRNIPEFIYELLDIPNGDYLQNYKNILYILRDKLKFNNEYFSFKIKSQKI